MSLLLGAAEVAGVYGGATAAQSVYWGGERVWVADTSGFTPADIAGLGLWLDAQQITGLADGDPVTAWTDASGNARNATADTASAGIPVYRSAGINGCPAVQFDGDTLYGNTMAIADWATALNGKTEYTLFMVSVISVEQGQNVPVVLTAPYESQGWMWLVEYDVNGGMFWGHVGYRRYDSGIVQDVPYLFTFHFPPAYPNADPHFYVNTAEVTGYTVYGSDLQTMVTAPGTNIEMSGYLSTVPYGYGLDGFIGEIIWYDHALTEPERQQIQDYLMTKWGLTVRSADDLPAPGPPGTPMPGAPTWVET